MQPGPKEAAVTAAFMPFGLGYRGGFSGYRLAGRALGGAERIVVGQLTGPGDGESLFERLGDCRADRRSICKAPRSTPPSLSSPTLRIQAVRPGLRRARRHDEHDGWRRPSRERHFASRQNGKVRKYQLVKPTAEADTLDAKQISKVSSIPGTFPNVLGGD